MKYCLRDVESVAKLRNFPYFQNKCNCFFVNIYKSLKNSTFWNIWFISSDRRDDGTWISAFVIFFSCSAIDQELNFLLDLCKQKQMKHENHWIICFWKKISILFYSVVSLNVTTIPITIKTSHLFITCEYFHSLKSRRFYAIRSSIKKYREWEINKRVLWFTWSPFVCDICRSLLLLFSFLFFSLPYR